MTHTSNCLKKFQYALYTLCYLKLCMGEFNSPSDKKLTELYENGAPIQIPIQLNRLDRQLFSPSYVCQGSGKFQDRKSTKSYWYCQLSPDGSFVAVRRSCPVGYVFSPAIRKCISRSNRKCCSKFKHKKKPSSYMVMVTEAPSKCADPPPCCPRPTPCCKPKPILPCKTTTTTTMRPLYTTCFTTTTTTTCPPPSDLFACELEGAFPDPKTQRSFYICHRKRNSQNYEKIKIECPKGMVFDQRLKWCTRRSKTYTRNKREARDRSRYNSNTKNIQPSTKDNQRDALKFSSSKGHVNYRRLSKDDGKLQSTRNLSKGFQCPSKGIFPDPINKNKYYICYQKERSPGYVKLDMKCPRNALFDTKHLVCFSGN